MAADIIIVGLLDLSAWRLGGMSFPRVRPAPRAVE